MPCPPCPLRSRRFRGRWSWCRAGTAVRGGRCTRLPRFCSDAVLSWVAGWGRRAGGASFRRVPVAVPGGAAGRGEGGKGWSWVAVCRVAVCWPGRGSAVAAACAGCGGVGFPGGCCAVSCHRARLGPGGGRSWSREEPARARSWAGLYLPCPLGPHGLLAECSAPAGWPRCSDGAAFVRPPPRSRGTAAGDDGRGAVAGVRGRGGVRPGTVWCGVCRPGAVAGRSPGCPGHRSGTGDTVPVLPPVSRRSRAALRPSRANAPIPASPRLRVPAFLSWRGVPCRAEPLRVGGGGLGRQVFVVPALLFCGRGGVVCRRARGRQRSAPPTPGRVEVVPPAGVGRPGAGSCVLASRLPPVSRLSCGGRCCRRPRRGRPGVCTAAAGCGQGVYLSRRLRPPGALAPDRALRAGPADADRAGPLQAAPHHTVLLALHCSCFLPRCCSGSPAGGGEYPGPVVRCRARAPAAVFGMARVPAAVPEAAPRTVGGSTALTVRRVASRTGGRCRRRPVVYLSRVPGVAGRFPCRPSGSAVCVPSCPGSVPGPVRRVLFPGCCCRCVPGRPGCRGVREAARCGRGSVLPPTRAGCGPVPGAGVALRAVGVAGVVRGLLPVPRCRRSVPAGPVSAGVACSLSCCWPGQEGIVVLSGAVGRAGVPAGWRRWRAGACAGGAGVLRLGRGRLPRSGAQGRGVPGHGGAGRDRAAEFPGRGALGGSGRPGGVVVAQALSSVPSSSASSAVAVMPGRSCGRAQNTDDGKVFLAGGVAVKERGPVCRVSGARARV